MNLNQIQTQGFSDIAAALVSLQGGLVTVFLVATMGAIGLQLTRADLVDSVRSYGQLGRWILANVLTVPLFALALGVLFDLSNPVLLALFLVAAASGAPFIPRLVGVAGGDPTTALRITAVLTVASAVTVPFSALLLVAVTDVEGAAVLRQFLLPLLVVFVVPMAVGAVVRDRSPGVAERVTPPLLRVANLSLFGVLVVIIVLDPGGIARVLLSLVGTGTLLVLIVFILGSIAIGWLAGSPTEEDRRLLALATVARNVGISLFVATALFPDSDTDAAIVAFTVLMVVVSGTVAVLLRHWRRR